MDDRADLPNWWINNQRLRDEMGLPEYRPPRFCDGTYTHETVSKLETELDIALCFRGFDTRYSDDFTVVADGEPLFDVGRKRDNAGNTIYQVTNEEFRKRVESALNPDH